MTAPTEWPIMVSCAEAGRPVTIAREADGDARARIAARLGLIALDRLVLDAEVRATADGMAVHGTIRADVVQPCAATDLPVAAQIDEPFALRFVRDWAMDGAGDGEEEIEISGEECDTLPLEDERVDVGEAAIQTLALALDPFPRHADADRILAEKGVLRDDQVGPFAALAALQHKGD